MSGEALRRLGWYNLKLTAHVSWLLSAVLLAAVPVFLSPELMERGQTAKLGEWMVSMVGLMAYPHLALLDHGGIGQTLYAKRVRPQPVFLFRWLVTTLFVFGVVAAFFAWLHSRGAGFALGPMIGGVGITAMSIGSAAMTFALLFGSLPAGYIAGFAWYLLDFTTKGKWTGPFYLFGLVGSEWDSDKWLLAGLSLLLAAFSALRLPSRRLD
ncbi:hypothetical protein J19TS2_55810 [Cohnella xylanilytica]|uniref:hypothetical protein n=1 Tax=Cohnella xylanilytica TaxID=557555 RepID=UPI001B0BF30B|nr:hypothetical protein [Cohnella xylanilytica]GIO16026.1 hypothetical protein J19TS2_55810 [Cohnella xylanilytica]